MAAHDYKVASPIITRFFFEAGVPTIADLTPTQLNTLYDKLDWERDADSNEEAEARHKTNLLKWIRLRKPELDVARGMRFGARKLIKDSMLEREQNMPNQDSHLRYDPASPPLRNVSTAISQDDGNDMIMLDAPVPTTILTAAMIPSASTDNPPNGANDIQASVGSRTSSGVNSRKDGRARAVSLVDLSNEMVNGKTEHPKKQCTPTFGGSTGLNPERRTTAGASNTKPTAKKNQCTLPIEASSKKGYANGPTYHATTTPFRKVKGVVDVQQGSMSQSKTYEKATSHVPCSVTEGALQVLGSKQRTQGKKCNAKDHTYVHDGTPLRFLAPDQVHSPSTPMSKAEKTGKKNTTSHATQAVGYTGRCVHQQAANPDAHCISGTCEGPAHDCCRVTPLPAGKQRTAKDKLEAVVRPSVQTESHVATQSSSKSQLETESLLRKIFETAQKDFSGGFFVHCLMEIAGAVALVQPWLKSETAVGVTGHICAAIDEVGDAGVKQELSDGESAWEDEDGEAGGDVADREVFSDHESQWSDEL